MNHTAYTEPEELKIVTLENAIYMGMKNDVAFLMHFHMYLYEHQSTVNHNMPLRFLQYVAKEYEKLGKQDDLYRCRRIRMPAPKFCVFYNGAQKQPEYWTEKLSESLEEPEENPALDLTVEFFNINTGMNRKLMENCKTLSEYMQYVDCVRKYARIMPLEEAVEQAVDECIRKGILAEFLRQNKAEVSKMSIFEYDEEVARRVLQEEAAEEGRTEGLAAGRVEGCEIYLIRLVLRKLQKGKSVETIAEELDEDPKHVERIYEAIQTCGAFADAEQIFERMQAVQV